MLYTQECFEDADKLFNAVLAEMHTTCTVLELIHRDHVFINVWPTLDGVLVAPVFHSMLCPLAHVKVDAIIVYAGDSLHTLQETSRKLIEKMEAALQPKKDHDFIHLHNMLGSCLSSMHSEVLSDADCINITTITKIPNVSRRAFEVCIKEKEDERH